jgi:hypothetical protein
MNKKFISFISNKDFLMFVFMLLFLLLYIGNNDFRKSTNEIIATKPLYVGLFGIN